jgi:Zn-dependent protease
MIFATNIFSNIYALIGLIMGLVIAISIHEFSHVYSANKLGDPTAKNRGRLTLNPLAHLDPLGTFFLIIAGFGWGKPVPINPNNFKNPKKDQLLTALSGPLSNIIAAFIFALPYRYIIMTGADLSLLDSSFLTITHYIVDINIILAIFNLLPIPPLDGSDIIRVILPENWFRIFEKIGPPILFILLFLELTSFANLNLFSKIFSPLIEGLSYLVRVFPS